MKKNNRRQCRGSQNLQHVLSTEINNFISVLKQVDGKAIGMKYLYKVAQKLTTPDLQL